MLIDIPKNIQTQLGSPEYPSHVQIRGYKPNETVHIGQLKKAYKLLKQAKRPLILAGGGINIAGAQEKLTAFAEKANVPVVTTIMGKGTMEDGHPLYVETAVCTAGTRQQGGSASATCSSPSATRFNDRITGDLNEFAPKAQIVHIDIDTASISRNVVVDVPVV